MKRRYFKKQTGKQLDILTKWCKAFDIQFSGAESCVITSAMAEFAENYQRHEITTMEQIIYKGIRIDKKVCIERGNYWFIPRRLGNKFSNEGYDLVPKKQCLSLNEYINKLEHHEATTVGLFATDRPDLINDPDKVMFEITPK